MRHEDGDGYSVFEHYFKKVSHLDPLSQLLYVDARTFLLDDNLTRVDRSSMMNSLEVRVPLLDDELVEFMRRVPVRIKQPGWGTKHLLRQAMKRILPENIVRGKKKGFTPPMPFWLRNELKEFMLDTLSEHRLAKLGILEQDYVTRLVDEHLHGHRDNNRQLWALITLVVWWDTYQPTIEN
jgi:asparagine synthase (glutamine-hydrolysing)